MKVVILLLLFLPCFCFSQERRIGWDDDMYIMDKLRNPTYRVYRQSAMDSVLGKMDSMHIMSFIIPENYVLYDTALCYPDAEFGADRNIRSFVFSPLRKNFFVRLGGERLDYRTRIDSVQRKFNTCYVPYTPDTMVYEEIVSGKMVKTKHVEVCANSGATDIPSWIFCFAHGRLVKMYEVRHDA